MLRAVSFSTRNEAVFFLRQANVRKTRSLKTEKATRKSRLSKPMLPDARRAFQLDTETIKSTSGGVNNQIPTKGDL